VNNEILNNAFQLNILHVRLYCCKKYIEKIYIGEIQRARYYSRLNCKLQKF